MGGSRMVGEKIAFSDITEFYYTRAASSYPPDYQRYQFAVENGTCTLYHETRKGDHWPLTEEDITLSGTVTLTEQQKAEFFSLLEGGQVTKRKEQVSSGASGPWLYLYWKGDRGKEQVFSFRDYGVQTAFAEFCKELVETN